MLAMLLAYTEDGDVVATLDYLVARDETGEVVGLVDFEAHELAGGELVDIWRVESDDFVVKGSKTWPEWIGARAHDFRVELEGPPGRRRIAALVHRGSGHRRERAAVESAIAGRIAAARDGEPADIRDLVGGPDRPLVVDEDGRTVGRSRASGAPRALPVFAPGREGAAVDGADDVRGIAPDRPARR